MGVDLELWARYGVVRAPMACCLLGYRMGNTMASLISQFIVLDKIVFTNNLKYTPQDLLLC